MALLGKAKICITESHLTINYINVDREMGIAKEKTLYRVNISGGNDEAMENVLNRYPEIYEILRKEL